MVTAETGERHYPASRAQDPSGGGRSSGFDLPSSRQESNVLSNLCRSRRRRPTESTSLVIASMTFGSAMQPAIASSGIQGCTVAPARHGLPTRDADHATKTRSSRVGKHPISLLFRCPCKNGASFTFSPARMTLGAHRRRARIATCTGTGIRVLLEGGVAGTHVTRHIADARTPPNEVMDESRSLSPSSPDR
jgi:hypothetical protein